MQNKTALDLSGLREATCPACGHHVAVSFYNPGPAPLATLAWPDSEAAAKGMERLPLDFVRCVECGHVYNAGFSYDAVPYMDKPNLMFNKGAEWSRFIDELQSEMLEKLPEAPTVVEIGHGDGGFLASMSKKCPQGRFVGFDPHGAKVTEGNVELRNDYFLAETHLDELKPDIIISRHVLEHFSNPLGFMQKLSFVASALGAEPLTYWEVPCIDRVLTTRRTVDLYFEHSSQFTTTSFTRMLQRCEVDIENIGHGYDGEVIYGFVRLGRISRHVRQASEAQSWSADTDQALQDIQAQLQDLVQSGKIIAIWGGTGKSAAFMHRYDIDAKRFPLVVDSDPLKAGTFVPGTGQEILFRDVLKQTPADVIIIPPQWRALDILQEMERNGISSDLILIEHKGRLIDFEKDPHPYGKRG